MYLRNIIQSFITMMMNFKIIRKNQEITTEIPNSFQKKYDSSQKPHYSFCGYDCQAGINRPSLGLIYIYIFFFFKTLPPTIMVQWKMGVYPILVSFHSGDPFSTSMGVFGYQPESMPTAGL